VTCCLGGQLGGHLGLLRKRLMERSGGGVGVGVKVKGGGGGSEVRKEGKGGG